MGVSDIESCALEVGLESSLKIPSLHYPEQKGKFAVSGLASDVLSPVARTGRLEWTLSLDLQGKWTDRTLLPSV